MCSAASSWRPNGLLRIHFIVCRHNLRGRSIPKLSHRLRNGIFGMWASFRKADLSGLGFLLKVGLKHRRVITATKNVGISNSVVVSVRISHLGGTRKNVMPKWVSDVLVAPQLHADQARSRASAGWKRQHHAGLPVTQALLDIGHLRVDHRERVLVAVMCRTSIT